MSGTKAGWEKRRKKMEYNAEGKSVFHAEIGAKGGKSQHERILAKDPKFASEIGKKGAAARKKKRQDGVK